MRLVAQTLGQRDPVANIPSIVIDMMLRSIVEAHFAVWYVWHVPTGAIFAPGMRELLAIPEGEVPTIVEEWLGRVHPDDLPRMVAENDLSLRTNSAFRSEYRFRHGQGGYISISDWGIVLSGGDGQAEWMAGGLRDITVEKNLAQAREEAAQLREVLFRKSLIPAFLLDGHGMFLDASQSALAFLQVEREALVGRPGGEFLPARLIESIRTPGLPDALGPMEVELKVAGRRKWLLATVRAVLGGGHADGVRAGRRRHRGPARLRGPGTVGGVPAGEERGPGASQRRPAGAHRPAPQRLRRAQAGPHREPGAAGVPDPGPGGPGLLRPGGGGPPGRGGGRPSRTSPTPCWRPAIRPWSGPRA